MKLANEILSMLEEASLFDANEFKTLGIKRTDMPQIEDKYQDEFTDYLKKNGVHFSHVKVKVSDLNPSQIDVNLDAVKNLVKSKSAKLDKPLIISYDNYVIDGHHRWYAKFLKDSNSEAKATRLSLGALSVIDLMRRFDKTVYKDIYNNMRTKL